MLQLQTTILTYNDQQVALTPGKINSFEALYVDFQIEQQVGKQRIKLVIHPKSETIVLKNIELQFQHVYQKEERIFCNGFQSWSESREFDLDESIPPLRSIAHKHMKFYGDTTNTEIKRGNGNFHSWTYSYIRQNKTLQFIGSLNEKTAFSIIQHDTKNNLLSIHRECDGFQLKHSYPALDIFIGEGKELPLFDTYFEMMECKPPTTTPMTGWTSWYHYYNNITEAIVLQNLEAFSEKKVPLDIIQIDDGFAQKVGDWLKIKDSFPSGMGTLARKIKAKGYQAGLWLAPFVCEEKSDIFQNKKHWLLKDASGKPVKVGYTPLWSGWFYALDFYHTEVQEYLTKVLLTVLDKWGYDMIKLDFLYAVCALPRPNKTRAQVMHEAMYFLRSLAGKKKILACGIPLGAAFEVADYCRIGADIHLKWEHRFLKWLRNRERVSTIVSLRCTLGRWQLNGRAFHNDPDVFLLRSEKNNLSPTQQYTILLINTLLGNVLFTSDFIGDYSEEQMSEFQSIFKWKNRTVQAVEYLQKEVYRITFSQEDEKYFAFCNLEKKTAAINDGPFQFPLEGYESIILKAVSK